MDIRKIFAEKILEFGNIAMGALVFGAMVNDKVVSSKLMLPLGICFFLGAYFFAYILITKKRRR
jgi:hypothetical protein